MQKLLIGILNNQSSLKETIDVNRYSMAFGTLEEVSMAFLYFLFFDIKNAEHFVIFKRTIEQWKVLLEQSLFEN